MIKLEKKKKKGYIISFILGTIIASVISVYALSSNEIEYNDTTLDTALDNLYNEALLNGKLSEVNNTGTLTVTDNTKNNMYIAIFAYVSSGNISDILNNRTSINSITGATATEVLYAINTSSRYGIRIYKLSDCEETITINSTNSGGYGNMILFD